MVDRPPSIKNWHGLERRLIELEERVEMLQAENQLLRMCDDRRPPEHREFVSALTRRLEVAEQHRAATVMAMEQLLLMVDSMVDHVAEVKRALTAGAA